jgi:hypothetical protein
MLENRAMKILSSKAAIAPTMLLAACGTSPADVQHARDAEARAREWLAQIDAGDYGGSWETAARLFQARVTKEEWEARVERVHPNLGRRMGRELVAAKYTATVPWEPPGEHVFVQYRVNYGGRASVESLTMRLDADQWKTLSYLIRPE